MNRLAEYITAWLMKHGTVAEEDKELYEYAVYSFILSISPVIMIMIIGCIMGKPMESILIIVPFMFMRKFSGGFHAKHAWVCMIFSCSILFLCVYMVAYLKHNIFLDIIMLWATISLVLLSPIDSENRRLDLSEKKRYKVITGFMVVAFAIIYCVLLFAGYEIYAVCIAEGVILTVCLQMPCMIIRLADKKDNAI